MSTQAAYQIAKEQYAKIGVDTDAVLERLKQIKVSIHCWQYHPPPLLAGG